MKLFGGTLSFGFSRAGLIHWECAEWAVWVLVLRPSSWQWQATSCGPMGVQWYEAGPLGGFIVL